MSNWLEPGTRKRRILLSLVVYAVVTAVMMIVAGSERLRTHNAFNHYAHLADAFLHGRFDLRNGPPAYAQGNDFAFFEGKWFISFPPLPAILMMPMVALAGSPENFQDGQFICWLSGIGPALLFLSLEKLRRGGRSDRSERTNLLLALLFAFGTVYFFTSVNGGVWFAAHVVGVAALSAFLLFAIDAESPLLAGVALGCMFLTRPHTILIGIFFVTEALRVTAKEGLVTEGSLLVRIQETWARVDKVALQKRLLLVAAPTALAIGFASYYNHARFHTWSPNHFGHEYLTVVWKDRMERWGLFGYHYLSKNLGVMLTTLPWLPPKNVQGATAMLINEHGLALWFTTPFYLWLLWPKKSGYLYVTLILAAAGPLVFDLLYQNSGWRQFGYRFSNDYSLLLFLALAVGKRRFGVPFYLAAAWALGWSTFGAISFDRGAPWDQYYWREGTQKVLYQDD
ncbi:MAG TPA: hypothetical protein VF316_14105 [Polyangiaceae bacterium]